MIFDVEPVVLIASSASCLIVNSPGLPRFTGPMVVSWFISPARVSARRRQPNPRVRGGLVAAIGRPGLDDSRISPSTRSSTKQKDRVWLPSP